MINIDSVLKSRDILLPTKVHLVKAMVFPVVMHGCERWTMKKDEHRRTDAFELWCWRTLLRVPWPARRFNQSILKEISPAYSLEGLMLKLKIHFFGHPMPGTLIKKDLDAGKDWGQEEKGTTKDEMVGWHHWFDGHELSKLWESVMDREAWSAAVLGFAKSRTWLSDWTDHWWMLSSLSLFGTPHSYGYIFPYLLCLLILFFSQLCVRPPQITILPFSISFLGVWSPPPVQHSSSGTLSIRSSPSIYLLLSLYNHKVFDLGLTWMALWFS